MIKKLKYLVLVILFSITGQQGFCQDAETNSMSGKVTYKSGQNVYVRFESTANLQSGDTLYSQRDGMTIPVLIIQNLSSISCVCTPVGNIELSVDDEIIAYRKPEIPESEVEVSPEQVAVIPVMADETNDSTQKKDADEVRQQEISGRVAVSSYSDISSTDTENGQRMRYLLSLDIDNINDSKFSFESYISFSHKNNQWDEIKTNIYNGLKIYNLAVHYNISEDMNLWFGRKINPRVSSLGAIDGVQFEKKFNAFTLGVIAGSRPDWADYSYNFDLFQAGIYAGHEYANDKINMQNTLALVDQENKWKTDRRFLYLQHTSRIMKKVYLFGSVEFDLYEKINEKKQNTFKLTNLYLQLRYRVLRNLSVSLSYSARNNIILYETYQSFIDQLLERETLQGFILSANLNPVKNINIGVKAGYRNRPGDLKASKNIYSYVNFTRLPVWDLSANVTAIFLETSYLKGRVLGVRFSRDLLPGKLYASAGYRNIHYDYFNQEYSLAQDLIELNLNLHMKWKMYASLNFESTFDQELSFHRIYINLTKRF